MAGLILAGGAGRRWGGPKAWARLPDGLGFLEACVAVLHAAGASPIVATLPCGATDPEIAGLNATPLPQHGLDMFASLQVGLRELLTERTWSVLMILPVDHPLVGPHTVAALATADSPAVRPTFHGKHGHPVGLARSVVKGIVDGRFEGPTLRDIVRSLQPAEVSVDDPAVIANCNTPAALTAALRALEARSPGPPHAPAVPAAAPCSRTQNSKLRTRN